MAVLGACGTNCSTKSPHKGLLPKQSNAACLLRLETPVPIRCRCRFRLSPGSARLVLAKLGLECALWHPASLFTFWTIVGAAEGHSASRIRDELRRWAVRASVSPPPAARRRRNGTHSRCASRKPARHDPPPVYTPWRASPLPWRAATVASCTGHSTTMPSGALSHCRRPRCRARPGRRARPARRRRRRHRRDFLPTLAAECCLWSPLDALNFWLVPSRLQARARATRTQP